MKTFVEATLAALAITANAKSLTNSYNNEGLLHRAESAYDAVQGIIYKTMAADGDSNSYLQHLESLSQGALESMQKEMETMVGELHGGSQCGQCVCKGTCHIMGAVKHGFEKICHKTKCPKLRHMCKATAAHPRFALGYTVAMIRPMEKSYFYCFGHGDCPHPNGFNHIVQNRDLIVTDANAVYHQDEADVMAAMSIGNLVDKIFEGHQGFKEVEVNGFEDEEQDTITSSNDTNCACKKTGKCTCKPGCKCPCCKRKREEEKILSFTDFGLGSVDESNCGGGPKCHMMRCTKRVGMKAFRFALHKIEQFCEHTKCPVMQKHCQMGKRHPEIAAGYLFQKIRPMEWSNGFCHGKIMMAKKLKD